MRKAFEPVPLNDGNPPAVSSASGLGTGGGAGVLTAIGSGWGQIGVTVGKSASSSGSIVLAFAQNPPSLFISAPPAFGAVVVSGQGTQAVTISWTGATYKPGNHVINYEWTTSQ